MHESQANSFQTVHALSNTKNIADAKLKSEKNVNVPVSWPPVYETPNCILKDTSPKSIIGTNGQRAGYFGHSHSNRKNSDLSPSFSYLGYESCNEMVNDALFMGNNIIPASPELRAEYIIRSPAISFDESENCSIISDNGLVQKLNLSGGFSSHQSSPFITSAFAQSKNQSAFPSHSFNQMSSENNHSNYIKKGLSKVPMLELPTIRDNTSSIVSLSPRNISTNDYSMIDPPHNTNLHFFNKFGSDHASSVNEDDLYPYNDRTNSGNKQNSSNYVPAQNPLTRNILSVSTSSLAASPAYWPDERLDAIAKKLKSSPEVRGQNITAAATTKIEEVKNKVIAPVRRGVQFRTVAARSPLSATRIRGGCPELLSCDASPALSLGSSVHSISSPHPIHSNTANNSTVKTRNYADATDLKVSEAIPFENEWRNDSISSSPLSTSSDGNNYFEDNPTSVPVSTGFHNIQKSMNRRHRNILTNKADIHNPTPEYSSCIVENKDISHTAIYEGRKQHGALISSPRLESPLQSNVDNAGLIDENNEEMISHSRKAKRFNPDEFLERQILARRQAILLAERHAHSSTFQPPARKPKSRDEANQLSARLFNEAQDMIVRKNAIRTNMEKLEERELDKKRMSRRKQWESILLQTNRISSNNNNKNNNNNSLISGSEYHHLTDNDDGAITLKHSTSPEILHEELYSGADNRRMKMEALIREADEQAAADSVRPKILPTSRKMIQNVLHRRLAEISVLLSLPGVPSCPFDLHEFNYNNNNNNNNSYMMNDRSRRSCSTTDSSGRNNHSRILSVNDMDRNQWFQMVQMDNIYFNRAQFNSILYGLAIIDNKFCQNHKLSNEKDDLNNEFTINPSIFTAKVRQIDSLFSAIKTKSTLESSSPHCVGENDFINDVCGSNAPSSFKNATMLNLLTLLVDATDPAVQGSVSTASSFPNMRGNVVSKLSNVQFNDNSGSWPSSLVNEMRVLMGSCILSRIKQSSVMIGSSNTLICVANHIASDDTSQRVCFSGTKALHDSSSHSNHRFTPMSDISRKLAERQVKREISTLNNHYNAVIEDDNIAVSNASISTHIDNNNNNNNLTSRRRTSFKSDVISFANPIEYSTLMNRRQEILCAKLDALRQERDDVLMSQCSFKPNLVSKSSPRVPQVSRSSENPFSSPLNASFHPFNRTPQVHPDSSTSSAPVSNSLSHPSNNIPATTTISISSSRRPMGALGLLMENCAAALTSPRNMMDDFMDFGRPRSASQGCSTAAGAQLYNRAMKKLKDSDELREKLRREQEDKIKEECTFTPSLPTKYSKLAPKNVASKISTMAPSSLPKRISPRNVTPALASASNFIVGSSPVDGKNRNNTLKEYSKHQGFEKITRPTVDKAMLEEDCIFLDNAECIFGKQEDDDFSFTTQDNLFNNNSQTDPPVVHIHKKTSNVPTFDNKNAMAPIRPFSKPPVSSPVTFNSKVTATATTSKVALTSTSKIVSISSRPSNLIPTDTSTNYQSPAPKHQNTTTATHNVHPTSRSSHSKSTNNNNNNNNKIRPFFTSVSPRAEPPTFLHSIPTASSPSPLMSRSKEPLSSSQEVSNRLYASHTHSSISKLSGPSSSLMTNSFETSKFNFRTNAHCSPPLGISSSPPLVKVFKESNRLALSPPTSHQISKFHHLNSSSEAEPLSRNKKPCNLSTDVINDTLKNKANRISNDLSVFTTSSSPSKIKNTPLSSLNLLPAMKSSSTLSPALVVHRPHKIIVKRRFHRESSFDANPNQSENLFSEKIITTVNDIPPACPTEDMDLVSSVRKLKMSSMSNFSPQHPKSMAAHITTSTASIPVNEYGRQESFGQISTSIHTEENNNFFYEQRKVNHSIDTDESFRSTSFNYSFPNKKFSINGGTNRGVVDVIHFENAPASIHLSGDEGDEEFQRLPQTYEHGMKTKKNTLDSHEKPSEKIQTKISFIRVIDDKSPSNSSLNKKEEKRTLEANEQLQNNDQDLCIPFGSAFATPINSNLPSRGISYANQTAIIEINPELVTHNCYIDALRSMTSNDFQFQYTVGNAGLSELPAVLGFLNDEIPEKDTDNKIISKQENILDDRFSSSHKNGDIEHADRITKTEFKVKAEDMNQYVDLNLNKININEDVERTHPSNDKIIIVNVDNPATACSAGGFSVCRIASPADLVAFQKGQFGIDHEGDTHSLVPYCCSKSASGAYMKNLPSPNCKVSPCRVRGHLAFDLDAVSSASSGASSMMTSPDHIQVNRSLQRELYTGEVIKKNENSNIQEYQVVGNELNVPDESGITDIQEVNIEKIEKWRSANSPAINCRSKNISSDLHTKPNEEIIPLSFSLTNSNSRQTGLTGERNTNNFNSSPLSSGHVQSRGRKLVFVADIKVSKMKNSSNGSSKGRIMFWEGETIESICSSFARAHNMSPEDVFRLRKLVSGHIKRLEFNNRIGVDLDNRVFIISTQREESSFSETIKSRSNNKTTLNHGDSLTLGSFEYEFENENKKSAANSSLPKKNNINNTPSSLRSIVGLLPSPPRESPMRLPIGATFENINTTAKATTANSWPSHPFVTAPFTSHSPFPPTSMHTKIPDGHQSRTTIFGDNSISLSTMAVAPPQSSSSHKAHIISTSSPNRKAELNTPFVTPVFQILPNHSQTNVINMNEINRVGIIRRLPSNFMNKMSPVDTNLLVNHDELIKNPPSFISSHSAKFNSNEADLNGDPPSYLKYNNKNILMLSPPPSTVRMPQYITSSNTEDGQAGHYSSILKDETEETPTNAFRFSINNSVLIQNKILPNSTLNNRVVSDDYVFHQANRVFNEGISKIMSSTSAISSGTEKIAVGETSSAVTVLNPIPNYNNNEKVHHTVTTSSYRTVLSPI